MTGKRGARVDPAPGSHTDFVCPISGELMRDPVVAADGNSYERESIQRWLGPPLNRRTSPLTNAGLEHVMLTPNRTLKKAIEDAVERQRRRDADAAAGDEGRNVRQRTE